MKELAIDAKHQRMLELLALGAPNRAIAEKMGYQEGTMRVYLHNLYKKIGVANKTEAVVWYLNKGRAQLQAAAAPPPTPQATDDVLGDMALREGLYTSLGVMVNFVGPFSRVWEVGQRLAGSEPPPEELPRRAQARLLWKALLEGDWVYGKKTYDADEGGMMRYQAPSDAVMLVLLLQAGGYTSAAERLATQLQQKRKSGTSISARETALITGFPMALEAEDREGIAAVMKLTSEKGSPAPLKQIASAALFHAYRSRKDPERARRAAHALWAESESARQQLRAMGDRTFGADAVSPPARPTARESGGVREKAVAIR